MLVRFSFLYYRLFRHAAVLAQSSCLLHDSSSKDGKLVCVQALAIAHDTEKKRGRTTVYVSLSPPPPSLSLSNNHSSDIGLVETNTHTTREQQRFVRNKGKGGEEKRFSYFSISSVCCLCVSFLCRHMSCSCLMNDAPTIQRYKFPLALVKVMV